MVEVRGKKYTVLEIIKKSKFPQQDLFVCMSEHGYRECFQRQDIENQVIKLSQGYSKAWTCVEEDYIKQKLLDGKSVREIMDDYTVNPRRRLTSIYNNAYRIKKELGLWEVGKM